MVPNTEQAWFSCLRRMPSQHSSHHCFRKAQWPPLLQEVQKLMSVRSTSPSEPSESFPLSFLPAPNLTPPHSDISSQFLNKAPRTSSVLSPEDAFAMDGCIAIACICECVWSEGPLCRLLRISSSFKKWCSLCAESIHPFLFPLSTSGYLQVLITYQHYGNGFYTIT